MPCPSWIAEKNGRLTNRALADGHVTPARSPRDWGARLGAIGSEKRLRKAEKLASRVRCRNGAWPTCRRPGRREAERAATEHRHGLALANSSRVTEPSTEPFKRDNMRCVALLSSGLDSQLAVRLMLQQGIQVEAVHVRTPFTHDRDRTAEVARELAVPLTVVDPEAEYLDTLRSPRFGRGGGMNPCIDCRIYMVRRAFAVMQAMNAHFMISGEVVGQRPMSQKRRDLETISHHSGCFDVLLRPLCAQNLPPTRPEREGWVDRRQLHGFSGRGRRQLIALARSLGIRTIPSPSSGCLLTDKHLSYRLFDLLRHQPLNGGWDFELLKHGRHFRYDHDVKVVLGRREEENEFLEYLHALPDATSTALVKPDDFRGPAGLIVGPTSEGSLRFACGLLLRYAKRNGADGNRVRVALHHGTRYVHAEPHDAAQRALVLAQR